MTADNFLELVKLTLRVNLSNAIETEVILKILRNRMFHANSRVPVALCKFSSLVNKVADVMFRLFTCNFCCNYVWSTIGCLCCEAFAC